jgi:hypothetical protein
VVAPVSRHIFAWAAIYTFWYHPMENTSGHHWLPVHVPADAAGQPVLHARACQPLVDVALEVASWRMARQAVYQGNGLWPMFAFGFGGILVITQMHGLGLSRLARWAILLAYIGLVLLTYSQAGWERLNEIVRIPVIEYLAVVVLALLISGGLWIARRLRGERAEVREAVA